MLIWTTLHVSDHSVHHRVYTELKFIGNRNSQYNTSILIGKGRHMETEVSAVHNEWRKNATYLLAPKQIETRCLFSFGWFPGVWRRGITQKKTNNILNTAKAWNQKSKPD